MERNSGHDDKECLTDKGARHDMNDEFGQEVEITDEEVAEADRINDFSEDLFLLATASRSERMKADVEQRLADFHRTHKAGNRRMSRHRVIGLVAVAAATVALFGGVIRFSFRVSNRSGLLLCPIPFRHK